MTRREISLWGVGPRIALAAVLYAVVAGAATVTWPEAFLISAVPHMAFLVAGALLLVIGVPMLVVAARAATMAYKSDKLATRGIFGIVRNPIYSAWIVFIIPGLVLFTRSWPLFLTPLAAYLAFKAAIRREDQYLAKRFGEAYREYRAAVNELIPIPRLKR